MFGLNPAAFHGTNLLLHAVEVTPPNPVAYNSFGVALLEEKRPQEAARWLREAVKLAPRDERAQQNLALALVQLRQTDESIAAFQAVLQINPRNALAHYNLGVLAESQGRSAGPARRGGESLSCGARDPSRLLAGTFEPGPRTRKARRRGRDPAALFRGGSHPSGAPSARL